MVLFVLSSLLLAVPAAGQPSPECGTVAECRTLAEQAAARHDYETFHDLAWRVVQKSPRNDPAAMTLVARAMSLSGRPGDALVMLQRLAAQGVGTDAATSEDFAAVRALDGWKEAAGMLAGLPPAPVPPAAPAPDAPAPAAAPAAAAAVAGPPEAPTSSGEARPAGVEAGPGAASTGDAHEAVRFSTAPFTPVGLAYDRVSDRFLVGDRGASKLTVVDEASSRVANLAAARTAGFGHLAAFEIDARQGDLWVVSTTGDGPDRTATLHKLQLISGRVLYELTVPDDRRPADFVDVAVTAQGTVLALDGAGGRVFEAAPRARVLGVPLVLGLDGAVSIAPTSAGTAYVSYETGLRRVDLGSGRSADVAAARGVDLTGLERVRWHRGGLIAVQRVADGTHRVVRLSLDGAGRRATRVQVLDRDLRMADPTAAAVSGDVLYYLASSDATPEAGQAEVIVKQVSLR